LVPEHYNLVINVNTGSYKPRVKACMLSVSWHCRVKKNITVSDICVEWVADGKTFEYNALDTLVRKIAASREWSAEELIVELKRTLEKELGQEVRVAMRFKEKEGLEVELGLGESTL
jgi:hypothetical protein